MKKKIIKDYHELNASIHVSADRDRQMTDEERKNYDKAISLLLGNDFEISVIDSSKVILASFEIRNGIVTVSMNDEISQNI